MENKMKIAVGIIVVLVLAIGYILVAEPMIRNFVIEQQLLGYGVAIQQIMLQATEQGVVQVQFQNDTMILIPVAPESISNE